MSPEDGIVTFSGQPFLHTHNKTTYTSNQSSLVHSKTFHLESLVKMMYPGSRLDELPTVSLLEENQKRSFAQGGTTMYQS